MGDEIMKAYTCGARAAFDGPPEKCPVRKGSKCRVSEPMLDCDAEPIYVYPKARHVATQAALAAAITTLQFALIDARNAGDTAALHTITETIAGLRALGKG